MSHSENGRVSRRALLGGAAVAVLGAGLAPPAAARAGGPGRPPHPRSVHAVASRLDRALVELRRDIHRHPETAGAERRTAALVAGRLRAAGLDVRTGVGGHGVVGVLTGAHPGRTVAYRADMDAVAPADQFGGGTTAAHLCGHDLHTTVGVGVAEVLALLRGRLSGSVVFVFQPAEETLSGAAAMLDADLFGRTRPAEIHALHCGPFPVGRFLVTGGSGLPGQDRGVVTLSGPDATRRGQRLAAEVNALGTVSPPATPADLEQLVADIQRPDGPLAEFVFMRAEPPGAGDPVEIPLAYRCWPEQRYTAIRDDIRRLASAYGGSVDFPADPFPAMVCPRREAQALRGYLHRTVGRARVGTLHAPVPFNGEDFALFLDRLPGTYTFLGVRAPGAGIETASPHFGTFDPDERAIGYGVRAMAGWLASRT
ncbi:M20 metallopeptidase family protein [Plantactinospora sp. WMMB782]|uniref:M20 metallopeptidase family protein n=1 Tax=Plantactinospora sp. WMMB782 TaxID=3404121 RepID=UPI003B943426